MRELLCVSLGGAAGTVLRYLIGQGLKQVTLGAAIPTGTMAVNILGGFLIGLLAGGKSLSGELRHLLVVGFLGGFTTFSAFSWDTASMATGGHPRCAIINVALTVLLTLGGTWLGLRVRGGG